MDESEGEGADDASNEDCEHDGFVFEDMGVGSLAIVCARGKHCAKDPFCFRINVGNTPSAWLAFVKVVDTDPAQQRIHWKLLRPTDALFADKGQRLLNQQECAKLPGFSAGSKGYPAFISWQKFELDGDSTASNVIVCADDIVLSWDPDGDAKRQTHSDHG